MPEAAARVPAILKTARSVRRFSLSKKYFRQAEGLFEPSKKFKKSVDQTRKKPLTVFFHTIIPSEISA